MKWAVAGAGGVLAHQVTKIPNNNGKRYVQSVSWRGWTVLQGSELERFATHGSYTRWGRGMKSRPKLRWTV